MSCSILLDKSLRTECKNSSSNNANLREETDEVFTFPEGAVRKGKNNIITIVQVSKKRLVSVFEADDFLVSYFLTRRITWD